MRSSRFSLVCLCLARRHWSLGPISRARAHQAAQEPRRQPHRHLRRRLHELLPVRLWQLAQGQPRAWRQGAVGTFRPAARAEPLDAQGHPRRGRPSLGTRTPVRRRWATSTRRAWTRPPSTRPACSRSPSDLSRIAATTSKEELLRVLGGLRRDGLNTLFTMSVGADLKDSTATLMGVDQGGTSLPDRDYYVKDDAKNRETREQYVAHMTRMLAMAGADNDVAASNAKAVLALETKLATAQLDRVGRRDPKNRDNKMTRGCADRAGSEPRPEGVPRQLPKRPRSPRSTSAGRSSSARSTASGPRPRSTI